MKQPSAIDNRYFEHLRYRGVRLKKHVLSPDCAIPSFRDLVWQSFKEHCATEGNILPLLIYNLEPQGPDPGMFRRRRPRNPKGTGLFEDLPAFQRAKAIKKFQGTAPEVVRESPLLATCYLAGSCSPTGASPAGLGLGQTYASHQRWRPLPETVPRAWMAPAE